MKCPYFKRRISSYRFSGIACKKGPNVGQLDEWTKEKREAYIAARCNGDYESCYQYQNLKGGNY